MTQLQAAVARADVTPPIGIAHANWGAQTHQRAAGVDLPLWATALALSDGIETVVIVDIDVLYLWKNEAARAREVTSALTGVPQSHIRLSYTHTHSGPVIGGEWTSWTNEGTEMVGSYTEDLIQKIAGTAWSALKNLRPVRVSAGRGACTIGVNRRLQRPEDGEVIVGRNWDGDFDDSVQVVRIDGIDGTPLATIVNYACHPITAGPDCQMITPDYPGVVKRVVEQSTGSTCLFLQGAAGDIGPIRGVARRGLLEYKRLGNILGHEASRVWWEIDPRPAHAAYQGTLESGAPLAIYDDTPVDLSNQTQKLRVETRMMDLPLKVIPPPDQFEANFEKHLARLNELRAGGGSEEELRHVTMLSKRASMHANVAREFLGRTHETYELQIITIGDEIALVAIPGEPFVEIGLNIKRNSPVKYTLFSGYSHIGWGYIPVPQAYELGGYEIEITPFAPAASLQIVDETLNLLKGIANSKR
jgi:hypothetical protein